MRCSSSRCGCHAPARRRPREAGSVGADAEDQMADQLIEPDQLPHWVPGQLTVHSPAEGRDGLSVRGYRYAGSDVEVPPMRDYMIVAYRRGVTSMRRRVDTGGIHRRVGPGD